MAKKKQEERKPFTAQEIQLIKDADKARLKDLAFVMGRTYESLRRKKWALTYPELDRAMKSLYKKKINDSVEAQAKNNRWSPAEEDLILTSDKTDMELALILGRTPNSIQVKRVRLLEAMKKNGRRKRRSK